MADHIDQELVCYCGHITHGEVITAVNNGCETIEAVRTYLNKVEKGKCTINHPLGICCHKEFQRIMDKNRADLN